MVYCKRNLSNSWVIQKTSESLLFGRAQAKPGRRVRDAKGSMLYVGGWPQWQQSFFPVLKFCYSIIQKLKFTLESWVRKDLRITSTRLLIPEWHKLSISCSDLVLPTFM